MTTINKEKVAKSFGQAAETYDVHARVQKRMARELVDKILSTRKDFRSILEIGCGTGFLTELLTEKFPQANILATDISPQMLGAARKKLSCYPKVSYLVADGEHLQVEGPFDLIVSSAVFQWFDSYPEPFAVYRRLLQEGGCFIFNTLGENTFCELRSALECLGIAQNKAPFVNSGELGGVLEKCGFQSYEVEQQILKDCCPSARELLVGIKKIGAHSMGFSLKEGEVFKLTGLYNTRYSQENRVYASYEVLYGLARK